MRYLLNKKEKKMLWRIILSAILLIVTTLLPIEGYLVPICYLIPYTVIGWDVLLRAVQNIIRGQVFDENFLMAIATVGAFAVSEYNEAVFVMLFYQIGEWFQDYAVNKSRASIAALMDIRPDVANLEGINGEMQAVDPEDVAVGAVIVVKPGERVPLDGVVLTGHSSLDTAALTGEAMPRDIGPGDAIISGCVNLSGVLRVKVSRPCEESTVSKILDLVENAGEKKAVSEQFITRFARYYTPCVVISAALLATIPPLFLGGWGNWFRRALIFLVVSCPCALVISVPLSFFGGIGGASRCGILVKGGNYLEALSKTETVVFDKTGTLTQGFFTVTAVYPEAGYTSEKLLETAALAEHWSNHPISLSLKAACKRSPEPDRVTAVEELAGYGVYARVDNTPVWIGNLRLMERQGFSVSSCDFSGTIIYVAIREAYAGCIVLSDLPKADAKDAIAALKNLRIQKTVMLSGDADSAVKPVASELGVDVCHAELLPADKVTMVENLLSETSPGTKLAFVGDGINDAPVLARADIGIAMGALGSDAAIEAADIVLMDDKPSKIALAIRISRKTMRIVRQNIAFALGIKGLVLVLGALGMASMWMAVFADVGVAFLAILNAMRCLQVDHLSD